VIAAAQPVLEGLAGLLDDPTVQVVLWTWNGIWITWAVVYFGNEIASEMMVRRFERNARRELALADERKRQAREASRRAMDDPDPDAWMHRHDRSGS
jgi:hypothetical protein